MYLECIQMTEDIDWLQLENTVSWLGFHMKKNRREKLPEGPIFLFQQTECDLKMHAYKLSVLFTFQMQRITRKTSKSNTIKKSVLHSMAKY